MSTFWLEDPKQLINVLQTKPDEYTIIQKLNMIMAIAVIISISLVLINKGDLSFIMIAIVFGALTIAIHEQYKYKLAEEYRNKCIQSTVNNPFMNPNILEPSNTPPCIVDNQILYDNFYTNTFRDVNDFYERGLSVRQFYTVPGKTIPNEREKLTEWLYEKGPSCKEGNAQRCIDNINLDRTDLRRVGGGSKNTNN